MINESNIKSYVKTDQNKSRTFWLVNNEIDAHKLNQNRVTKNIIPKQLCNTPESSWKVKTHMFKVPVFVASLTEPLSFLVSGYDQRVKENRHAL